MKVVFSHDMEPILFSVALAAVMLGSLWYTQRGERIGSTRATLEGRFGLAHGAHVEVRRLARGQKLQVRLVTRVFVSYRGVTLSADEASDCALTLEEGGARRCGGLEIAPDFDTGDGSRMRLVLPLDWSVRSRRPRMLLTRPQAKMIAAWLRAASAPQPGTTRAARSGP